MSRTDNTMPWKFRPDWPEKYWRYKYTWGPRPIDRRLGWYGPDRALARDQLKSAAKEYRAAGEVETVVINRKHHHSPWKGGWWD